MTAPVMTGTFMPVPYSALDSWTLGRWEQELADMTAVGITTIILQGVSYADTSITHYPSPAPSGYTVGVDYVTPLLTAAALYGCQVYLGLGHMSYTAFFNGMSSVFNTTFLDNQVTLATTEAAQLIALFGSSPALVGWYLPLEIDDYMLTQVNDYVPLRDHYYTPAANALHASYPAMKVMTAPFYSGLRLAPSAYAAQLANVVAAVDICNLQDGGGGQPGNPSAQMSVTQIGTYFSACAAAFSGTSVVLWDDPDMFDNIHNGGGPLEPVQLQHNIAAAAPFVVKITGFSFTSQMGPHDTVGSAPYAAYQAYLLSLGTPPLPAPILPPASPNPPLFGPRYTYIACDAVTNKQLMNLPLTQVVWQRVLNSAGSFDAYLPLSDPRISALNWDKATTPARTVLYALRGDQPVWGGIIWTRDYDSQTQALHLQAATFESYLDHIPYVATTTWTNIDQLRIVRDLIASIATSGYTIPMPVSMNTSGVFRDFQTLGSEYKWVSDIFHLLQELPNGFDFGFDVYFNAAIGPYKQLTLSYPRRGQTIFTSQLVLEYPGNIAYYKWPEDGTAFATDIVELGAGSGPTMAVGLAGDNTLLTDGWPILFQVISRKDVTDPDFLTSYAIGDLALYRVPSTTAEVHLRVDMDPLPGTYTEGDDVRVRIVDPRFPAGLDVFMRVQGIKVTVGDDGTEDVALTCVTTVA